MDEKKIEFRFLSGANIGSAFVLPQGEYLVGNSDACDILIYDTNADSFDARLVIDNDEVFIEPLNGAWFLNKNSITGKTSFKKGDFLSIGVNTICWQYEGEPFVALNSLIDTTKKPSDTDEKIMADTVVEELKDDRSTVFENEEKTIKEDLKPQSYTKRIVCGGIILLILLFLLIAGNFFFKDKKLSVQDQVELIQNKIAELLYTDLQVKFKDGLFTIEGSIPTQKEYDTLLEALPTLSYPLELKVALLSDKEESIKRSFRLYDIEVQPSINNESVDIYGYIIDPYHENDVLNSVKGLLPVPKVNSKFTYKDALEVFLNQKIAENHIPVALTFKEGYIVYDGKFTPEQYRSFLTLQKDAADFCHAKVIFKDIRNESQNTIEVLPREFTQVETKDAIASTKEPSQSFVAISNLLQFNANDIEGVTLKPLRFISLKNGNKYFEGAVLPNGFTLEKIAVHQLILEKNGEKVVYELK